MNTFKSFLFKRPLVSAILLVAVFVLLPFALSSLLTIFFRFNNSGVNFTIYNFIISGLLVWFIISYKLTEKSGLVPRTSSMNWKSWLGILLFLIVELRFLLAVNSPSLSFTTPKVLEWLALWLSVGLKEELLWRGIILYLLFQAWGHSRIGLFKACIAQAVLFGLLHYLNVLDGENINGVHIQVIGAFFIGTAYGGLFLITRSIWPVVIFHTISNALMAMNSTFGLEKLVLAPVLNDDAILPVLIFNGTIYLSFGTVWLLKSRLNSKNFDQIMDTEIAR